MTIKIQTPTPVVEVMMKGENPTRHPAGKYVTVHKEKCSPVTGEIRAITGNQVMRGTGLEIAEEQMDQKTKIKILQMRNGRGPGTGGDHHEDLIKNRRKRRERKVQKDKRERRAHHRMKKMKKKKRRRTWRRMRTVQASR